MFKKIVIAVDGPAASGKGTLAKKIAEYFKLDYLDTGSIYRALGYEILRTGVDWEDKDKVIEVARTITEEHIKNPNLYNEGVGRIASIVSAIGEVRAVLFDFQKDFANSPKGAVLDGRDIGTVVCPDADFKFYITADLEARAQRRYKQLQNSDKSIIYELVLEDLRRRDERDSRRAVAPLKPAEDSMQIDTTTMGIDDVFSTVVEKIAGASTC